MRTASSKITAGVLLVSYLALGFTILDLRGKNEDLRMENSRLAQQVQVLTKSVSEVQDALNTANNELQQRADFDENVLNLYRSNQVSRGEQRPRIVASYNMTATAYGCHPVNGGAGSGVSAVGSTPEEGRTIAVDPRVIPLHSKVLITCADRPDINGVYRAEDTGGDIKSGRIDIYFDDLYSNPSEAHRRMIAFGTKEVTVHVLAD